MKAFKKILIIFGLSIIILFVASIKSNATSINSTDVTIYTCADIMSEFNLEMPSEYPTSFQLKFDGEIKNPKCTPINDYATGSYASLALKVDDKGLITPIKNKSGTYYNGDFKIKVKLNNEEYEVTVHLIEYQDIYTDKVMDDYIKNNITNSMTEYEKMEEICKFVASFDYSTNPSFRSMIIRGSGDCLASSNCIVHMCDKIGIKSYVRYAADDPGAGSGHRNVTALLDGKVYIVEDGLDEKAPRHYFITYIPDGVQIYKVYDTNKYALCRYDGFESNVVVPKYYNGEEVKIIFKKSFSYYAAFNQKSKLESVTLPDSIETIEDNAFANCKDLRTINIPKSVKDLTPLAFDQCTGLREIVFDDENPYFSYKDGVIYNKDKTEVIMCKYSDKKILKLDENVKTIKSNAFSDCQNIDTVILGENVETIEPKAFYKGSIKSITIPKNVKTIGSEAFEGCPLNFCKIENGSTVKLDVMSFHYLSSKFEMIIPDSVTEIDKNMTRNDAIIYGKKGSSAEEYATQTKTKFVEIDLDYFYNNGIIESMVILDQDEYIYDGLEKKPKVIVTDGFSPLTEGKDYICKIENNINAGNATVIVTGIGNYNGEITKTFTIKKANNEFEFEFNDIVYGNKITPVVTKNLSNGLVSYYYSTDDNSTWTGNQPTDVGEYNVRAYVSSTQNYYAITKYSKVKIIQAENKLEIRCSNVTEGNTPKPAIILNKSNGDVTYYYKKENQDDSYYSRNAPTSKGKYVIKAISKETKNYKEGITSSTFEIIEKSNSVDEQDQNNNQNNNQNLNQNNLSSKTLENIKVQSITKCKLTGIKNKTYNSKKQTQSIVVVIENKTLKNGIDYTILYKNNKNVGTATVVITGKGNYTGTVTKKFKINPKGTSLKKLTAGKKQFKATWKAQKTQTTGYQVQYSTNSKFKSGNKTVKIKKNKTTSSTVKKLKAKKKYYVRIRTYRVVNGNKIYSSWSKPKNIKVK